VLPELDLARITKWVQARNDALPDRAREQIRYELDVSATAVTIVVCRPPWRPDYGPDWSRNPRARLRYATAQRSWTLYWSDRNSRFHEYDLAPSTSHVNELLAAIDRDETGIFWG
jgi:hypothetical protein